MYAASVVSVCLAASLLVGCAAALVPASNDPATKLNQARALWREGRIIPAERLIGDAIELAREQKNYLRLGEAQLTYAQFLRSSAFNDKFFDDKRAKLGGSEGVRAEARRYLREAEKSYVEAEPTILSSSDPFDVSNLWMRRSLVYQELDDRVRACEALQNSLATHRTAQERKPGTAVRLPPGFKTFDEFIQKQRVTLGCS
jgi:tetratricopeptide (TPR) repeat protein